MLSGQVWTRTVDDGLIHLFIVVLTEYTVAWMLFLAKYLQNVSEM